MGAAATRTSTSVPSLRLRARLHVADGLAFEGAVEGACETASSPCGSAWTGSAEHLHGGIAEDLLGALAPEHEVRLASEQTIAAGDASITAASMSLASHKLVGRESVLRRRGARAPLPFG